MQRIKIKDVCVALSATTLSIICYVFGRGTDGGIPIQM